MLEQKRIMVGFPLHWLEDMDRLSLHMGVPRTGYVRMAVLEKLHRDGCDPKVPELEEYEDEEDT